VVSNHLIQKRKYTAGYSFQTIHFPWSNRTAKIDPVKRSKESASQVATGIDTIPGFKPVSIFSHDSATSVSSFTEDQSKEDNNSENLLIHKRVIKPRLSPEIEELKTYQPVPKSITASIFLALIGLLIWLLVSQLVGFIIGGAALVFAIIAMNKVLEPNDNKRDYALAIVALILSILSVFGAFVVSYMLEFGQII